jgi:hypothetical protein
VSSVAARAGERPTSAAPAPAAAATNLERFTRPRFRCRSKVSRSDASEGVGVDIAARGTSSAGQTSKALFQQLTWWALVFPAVMVVALARHDLRLLNWIHVLSGVLWTGADIFLGFIVGPVLRRLDITQRTAFVTYFVPRSLLYFPAVSLTTGTAGWYLASWLGLVNPAHPQFPWVVGALILISLMTILGVGIMTPNGVRIWLELRKPEPNRTLIVGLNRWNVINAAVQGTMQIAIIIVMAHLTLG